MEEKKKCFSDDWAYVDEIVCQVWGKKWEQINPLEKKLLRDHLEKKEFLEFQNPVLPAGMFCISSASLENMFYSKQSANPVF